MTGIVTDANGQRAVAITVSAAPHDGAANDAVRDVLARWLGVAKSSLHLCRGGKSRHKQFELLSDDAGTHARIMALLAGENGED